MGGGNEIPPFYNSTYNRNFSSQNGFFKEVGVVFSLHIYRK